MRPAIASAARAGSALGDAAIPTGRSFVCRECIARGSGGNAAAGQRRFYADKKNDTKRSLPVTERLRRKIWGTDSPPGAKDPYGQSQFAPEAQNELESPEQEAEVDEVKFYDGSTIEDAKAFDSEYEPADNWEGLSRIGGAKGWWEKVWDEDNQFRRWAAPTIKNLEPKLAADYIHQAFVELTVLQQAGLDINDACFLPTARTINFNQVKISGGDENDKPVTLTFPEESWRQDIIDAVDGGEGEVAENEMEIDETSAQTDASTTADADTLTPTAHEIEALTEDIAEPVKETEAPRIEWADQPEWRHTRIPSDVFKFALAKRITQITGTRIPDHVLDQSKELGVLMQTGFKWRKPEKLAEELLTESKDFKKYGKKWELAPNVTVHKKRVTYVDRENTVGRWKSVKEELLKRDLPVPRRRGNY